MHPSLEQPTLIDLTPHADARGFLVESFKEQSLTKLGIACRFVQENHSRSLPGILRGLHFQKGQGKLIYVLQGRVFDVAVDIRPSSNTFGKYYSYELDDSGKKSLWIPPGFAHGFCVLGQEHVNLIYKVTKEYNPNDEGGLLWSAQDVSIPWPIKNPIVSERDSSLPIDLEQMKVRYSSALV